MKMTGAERVWIDVDLDLLEKNYRTAVALAGKKLTCVLKANAYGHGIVPVARCLQAAGSQSFAVSCVREGLLMRRAGITGEILVMGASFPEELESAVRAGLTLAATGIDELENAGEAAKAADRTVTVHLKADTGFHRLGFECTAENAALIARTCRRYPMLNAEGLFSHLGLTDRAHDERQNEKLLAMRGLLEREGVAIRDLHLCDSIGMVRYPDWRYDRVRAGAFLFGVRPYRTEDMPFECFETLSFCTRVARIHTAKAGEVIGYGDDDIADHDRVIATLCAGYGDGYPRYLSNGKGRVMLGGQLCPTVGLVCMDQMMVDITAVQDRVRTGDVAYMIGGGLSYDEAANQADTNRNERLTILSARPVRRYFRNGAPVATDDAYLNGGIME